MDEGKGSGDGGERGGRHRMGVRVGEGADIEWG